MGYEGRKRLRLKFADGEYEGLVVETRSPSMDTMFKLNETEGTEAEVTQQILEMFVEHLHEWNLLDDGKPVERTVEAFRAQDHELVKDILGTWMDAVNGVGPDTAPLEQPSTDGDPSVEESMPMETLSESLAS